MWNISEPLEKVCHKELRWFWRHKRFQTGVGYLNLTNFPVSVCEGKQAKRHPTLDRHTLLFSRSLLRVYFLCCSLFSVILLLSQCQQHFICHAVWKSQSHAATMQISSTSKTSIQRQRFCWLLSLWLTVSLLHFFISFKGMLRLDQWNISTPLSSAFHQLVDCCMGEAGRSLYFPTDGWEGRYGVYLRSCLLGRA